jgi:Rrf2 family protein
MKLSKKGDYALRALVHLSRSYPDVVPIAEIAEKEVIPLKFLEQILLLLRNMGYVRSRMGPKGGYYLARPPAEIALGEVIRAVDGPLAPISCVSRTAFESCSQQGFCRLRMVLNEVRNDTAKRLDSVTFADICGTEPSGIPGLEPGETTAKSG